MKGMWHLMGKCSAQPGHMNFRLKNIKDQLKN